MWLRTLRIEQLRSFAAAGCELAPGTNLFLGPNGAGKTTLLEAAYLLSHGRSFRAGGREALLARGAEGFRVHAEVVHGSGRSVRVGLERGARGWAARRDGAPIARLSDLFRDVAVVCFEPGSHELVGGASPERRAFLDWGVFHVEREFIDHWRRYQRALRQRNEVLRERGPDAALAPWDAELVRSGTPITAMRVRYASAFGDAFARVVATILPELGAATLELSPGHEGELGAALGRHRLRDRQRGTTTTGPHRADWRIVYEAAPQREHLSRGQEKLTALAAVLAQAECYRTVAGDWPVLALDDLPSELDASHQAAVLDAIAAMPAQRLLTATEWPDAWRDRLGDAAEFHVERGRVARAGSGPENHAP